MLQIPCPWCGLRDETEFSPRGEIAVRPDPDSASDAQWVEYLYYRDNVRGWQHEYWAHTYGCQQLFAVKRHTLTQAIESVA